MIALRETHHGLRRPTEFSFALIAARFTVDLEHTYLSCGKDYFYYVSHIKFNFYVESSCDLDEWTAEQLTIVKVSGNGNAEQFF